MEGQGGEQKGMWGRSLTCLPFLTPVAAANATASVVAAQAWAATAGGQSVTWTPGRPLLVPHFF